MTEICKLGFLYKSGTRKINIMPITAQLAKHLRDVHFGGNWTCSNLRDQLKDVSWQQAIKKAESFNTIATLVFHVNYYVSAIARVLNGEELNAKDEYSFHHPPINSQEDWEYMLSKVWADAENCAALIEQLDAAKLDDDFTDKKYGSYARNLLGLIEHTHYHLGQIVILKKILLAGKQIHNK